MSEPFINPISVQAFSGKFFEQQQTVGQPSSVFGDIFRQAIQNVTTSEEDLNKKEYLLATGQIDDAHTVPIATAKAQLSVDLLIALRTKALESYNEIIRLNV